MISVFILDRTSSWIRTQIRTHGAHARVQIRTRTPSLYARVWIWTRSSCPGMDLDPDPDPDPELMPGYGSGPGPADPELMPCKHNPCMIHTQACIRALYVYVVI